MCGIAGYIGDQATVERSLIEKMIAVIGYRGPDGDGVMLFEKPGVGLGHRRLSIIDPRASGNQPLASWCQRYWVVFNGEIYNYLEIRQQLQQQGHQFRTDTDTEVLIEAYRAWGEECLNHFIGMFAFALWDTEEKTLFAARDRLGIKPFYYTNPEKCFAFASEVKSLLALGSISGGVETSLIGAYMDFGYVPGENTLHLGVKRLLPGHKLRWHDGQVAVSKYWDFCFSPMADGFDARLDEIRELLVDSVSLRLRSDVPLGVFLSGGLDSSAVVALLSPGSSSGLKTFSVAYDFGKQYNEMPYAREISRKFNTDHHEIIVTPKDFLDFIPDYIWHMDEPVTEAAAISLYYLSRLAKEHVTVCLSGEGADELFAGYDFYQYNLVIEKGRKLLGASGVAAMSALGRKLKFSRRIRKYLDMATQPLDERYHGISSYDRETTRRLYSKEFSSVVGCGDARLGTFLESLFSKSKNWDPLSRMLYFDTKTWLVDDLLIKADRMSMATSIELRVPFLDHRVVEAAARTPSKFKVKGREPKYILKEMMKNNLPSSIIKRKKMGFPTPLEIMFRGELYKYAHETLLSHQAINRGYFNRSAVETLLSDHRAGKAKNHREIWQLVVLEEWHRQFNY
ncbi:MAG: asparagine synthase (glutamine-hydrolyzing) [Spirochaetales bacterium]|jgi:asparagine synthase (glutamine-hydrolysing)|nr:asparagine synthase (glutamine-hydrolyzing) [Spirochaetales bacterium]